MNKKILLLPFILLTLSGCTNNQKTSNSDSIKTENNLKETKISNVKVLPQDAVKVFNKTFSGANITGLELEKEDGIFRYEIEGSDNQNEYELVLNANNKSQIKKNSELEDDPDNKYIDTTNLGSLKKIIKTAESKLENSSADELSLKKYNGKTLWKVTVKSTTEKKKIYINPINYKVEHEELDD